MWEIDRETVAKVLRFLSQGLREIDLEKARQGQKRLASRVTTSASKQIDLSTEVDSKTTTSLTSTTKEKQTDQEDIDLEDHTKFDLRLSLDLCEVRLKRFDSNELCKMCISGLGLNMTQKISSVDVKMKFDFLDLTEQKREILHVPRTVLHFAQIKDDSSIFRGYNIDLDVMISPDVRLVFVNRFVQDVVRYSTTGPIIRAANEMSEAPVVRCVRAQILLTGIKINSKHNALEHTGTFCDRDCKGDV